MIWSVSMLAAGSTTVREVSVVKGSIVLPRGGWPLHQLARIGDPAAHRAGRGGEGAREEGACAASLAAFEIAIAGAHAVLAAPDHIAVHAEAHGAARFAPLRARFEEHPIEAFGLRLTLDLLGAGHHAHPEGRGNPPSPQHAGGAAQGREPRSGAAAVGDDVHLPDPGWL